MTKLKYRFRYPDRFVAGSLGNGSERESIVQARHGQRLTNVACDPEQVLALAHHINEMLNKLELTCECGRVPSAHDAPQDVDPLDLPLDVDFRAGTMTISFLRAEPALQIELFAEGEYEPDVDPDAFVEVLEATLTLEQARDFVARSCSVILAGGMTCPNCHQAMHPSGHMCPRRNGFSYPLFQALTAD